MDLNEPLGMTPPPKSRRRLVLAIGGIVVLVAVGGLAIILATADPHGGEPYAVAVVPQRRIPPAAKASIDPIQTGSLTSTRRDLTDAGTADPADAKTGDVEHGVKVFRSSRPVATGAGSGPLIIDVSKALDNPLGRRKPDPSAAERGTPGAAQPRIAIFVSGMGLSQATTRSAIGTMPAAVTFAFVPYGASVPGMVAAARAKGHEILLQIPMQNATGGSPGPHALRPEESADALAGDIAWLTSRFDGYDGVTNLLGAPVTADRTAMTALLKAVAGRGLFYLDDGTSIRSVAAGLAPDLGVGTVQADIVLDATADPAVVAANLDHLLAIARRKGSAIGMATGLPDHLPAIARFASDIGAKGMVLVPVAAIAAQVKDEGTKNVAKTMAVTR